MLINFEPESLQEEQKKPASLRLFNTFTIDNFLKNDKSATDPLRFINNLFLSGLSSLNKFLLP